MFDKTLFLSFENAGIFKKKWTKKNVSWFDDRIYNIDYKISRKKTKIIGTTNKRTRHDWEEILINRLWNRHVANMLCVLAGRRPSPKFRNSIIELDSEMLNIANRAKAKVRTIYNVDKKGQHRYIYENQQLNKSVENAWDPSLPVSWYRMEKLVSPELYRDVLDFLKQELGNDSLSLELLKVIELISDKIPNNLNNRKFYEDIKERAKKEGATSGIIYLLEGNTKLLSQNGYRGLGSYLHGIVKKGVCKVARLDGNIAVPLKAKEVDLFRNGSGMASLLEGGLVIIDCLADYYEPDLITYDDLYKGV